MNANGILRLCVEHITPVSNDSFGKSSWINAVCTQHSERLVIFMYTKTNLLV